MCIGRHVKYPLLLSDFKYQISRKSVQWEQSCSMRTDGQADRHDEAIIAFRKFAKAPNNLQHTRALRGLF